MGVFAGLGGPGRLGVLCSALAALACAAPAAAQLPAVPEVDRTVVEDVRETLAGSAPAPVEQVLNESPVPPVLDEVDRTIRDVTGVVDEAPGAVATPSPAPPAGGAAPAGAPQRRSSGGAPRIGTSQSAGGSTPSEPVSEERGAGRRAARRARTDAPARGRSPSRREARRAPASAGDGEPGSVVQTVEKLVKVVPRVVWIALGLLLAAALALAGRTLVERRRTRALRRERERLIDEVRLLERALLPDVPVELGALEASVAYRPCEGPAAGGDFYDAFELGDGRVAALVGDVSGHGPDALEMTNSTRTEVRACLEAGMSPRLALQAVGTRAGLHESGRFVTAVVAVHDRSAGTLTYATAGHSPPIVSGPGAHEPITAVSSPPIGLGFPTGLRETTVPLPPGSVGCLFTDGLLEARADGELLGRERLEALLDELADDETAQALLDRVLAEADEANDDMAVLVLRVRPGLYAVPPRVETLEVEAEDLDRGVAEAFLDACGLSPEAAEGVLEDARGCVSRAERAVVEVTFDRPGGRADVSPGSEPRAPTLA